MCLCVCVSLSRLEVFRFPMYKKDELNWKQLDFVNCGFRSGYRPTFSCWFLYLLVSWELGWVTFLLQYSKSKKSYIALFFHFIWISCITNQTFPIILFRDIPNWILPQKILKFLIIFVTKKAVWRICEIWS